MVHGSQGIHSWYLASVHAVFHHRASDVAGMFKPKLQETVGLKCQPCIVQQPELLWETVRRRYRSTAKSLPCQKQHDTWQLLHYHIHQSKMMHCLQVQLGELRFSMYSLAFQYVAWSFLGCRFWAIWGWELSCTDHLLSACGHMGHLQPDYQSCLICDKLCTIICGFGDGVCQLFGLSIWITLAKFRYTWQ